MDTPDWSGPEPEPLIGREIGYSHLIDTFFLKVFPRERPARTARVDKITPQLQQLGVPPSMAPAPDDLAGHLRFALAHEGVELQALMPILRRLSPESVAAAFIAEPANRFAKIACYLWEIANERTLDGLPEAEGEMEKLFDETIYLTDHGRSSGPGRRWRVVFNGIGSPRYCVTVRRTPRIEALLKQDLLGQAAAFTTTLSPALLLRALDWAYMSETKSSFAIEQEKPGHAAAASFVHLLAEVYRDLPITEDYLVHVQNVAMLGDPLNRAFGFRAEQNRLRNAARGVLGVSYLPPPPELLGELVDEVMRIGNDHDSALDTLVRASIVKFGFVHAHPFMDGNGRVSRFLFHKVSCADLRLAHGFVLPVSLAMERNEADYLRALRSFSKPARELWKVTMAGDNAFIEQFEGEPDIYRYWDATDCVEFSLRMAQEALNVDLVEESDFLRRHDAIRAAVEPRSTLRGRDLRLMVRSFASTGRLSKNRHRQLVGRGHAPAAIDAAVDAALEATTRATRASTSRGALCAAPSASG